LPERSTISLGLVWGLPPQFALIRYGEPGRGVSALELAAMEKASM
jgi:hypothetical protein